MPDFSTHVKRAIRPEWDDEYVQYGDLKAILKSMQKRRKDLSKKTSAQGLVEDEVLRELNIPMGSVHEGGDGKEAVTSDYLKWEGVAFAKGIVHIDAVIARLSEMERSEFCQALDGQLERAAAFYGKQMSHLTNLVSRLDEQENNKTSPKDVEERDPRLSSPETVGLELLELMAFAVVNILTLRQALIRYDAFVRNYGGSSLSNWYLQTREDGSSGSHVSDLFQLESMYNLEAKFLEMVQRLYPLTIPPPSSTPPTSDDSSSTLTPAPKATEEYVQNFQSQCNKFLELLDKSSSAIDKASAGRLSKRDYFMSQFRKYLLAGTVKYNLSMEPRFVAMRGRSLKKELKAVSTWRETNNLDQADGDSVRLGKLDPANRFPLLLNLASCFLYMMNSYIVEPSSAYYVESLGAKDALAGIVIGLTPWAALISAICYSFWTNYSYKQPILLAGCLAVIGNVMYGNAYTAQSVQMCLIGRVLCGLGAPRIINRRYIADATPMSLRTAANAAFGVATAMGAAMGPGMAIVLDLFNFQFNFWPFGVQTFNGMTGPGYFMAMLWTIYAFIIIFFFNEPNRTGLEELKKLEAQRKQDRESVEVAISRDEWDDDSVRSTTTPISVQETSPLACGCFQHITVPVVVCMTLIFLKRVALESVVGATSIITKNRFGWTVKNVGTLHFINGLLVIPISTLAGFASQYYQDRYLAIWLMVFSLIGCLTLIDPTDFVSRESENYNEGQFFAVGPVQYIAGSVIAFAAIEACESFVASLMSKVVPVALAGGTFNAGLLATLVGTSGRACGDLFISAMGYISIRNLLNLLMVPSSFLMILSILLVWRFYDRLQF